MQNSVQEAPRKGRQLNLRLSVGWTVLGNLIYAFTNFLFSVILAHTQGAFGPAMVGIYTLCVRVASPPLGFATLNTNQLFVVDESERTHYAYFLGLRIAALAVAAAYVLITAPFQGIEPIVYVAVIAYMVGVLFDNTATMIRAWTFVTHRMDRNAFSYIIRGVASVVVFALAVVLLKGLPREDRLIAGILGSSLVSVLMCYPFDAWMARRSAEEAGIHVDMRPRWNWSQSKRMITRTLLLSFSTLALAYAMNMPVYVLASKGTLAEVGILGASINLLTAGRQVVTALNDAFTPRMVEARAARNWRKFEKLVGTSILFAATSGATIWGIIYFLGPFVMNLSFGAKFLNHQDALLVIAASAGISFCYNSIGYAVTALKILNQQFLWTTIGLVASVPLSVVLVGRDGLLGAAWAFFWIQVVVTVLGFALLAYYYRGIKRASPAA